MLHSITPEKLLAKSAQELQWSSWMARMGEKKIKYSYFARAQKFGFCGQNHSHEPLWHVIRHVPVKLGPDRNWSWLKYVYNTYHYGTRKQRARDTKEILWPRICETPSAEWYRRTCYTKDFFIKDYIVIIKINFWVRLRNSPFTQFWGALVYQNKVLANIKQKFVWVEQEAGKVQN